MAENTKRTFIQSIKFFLFSISAGAIQLGSFALFNDVCDFSYWPSYLISLILSVIWSFTLNRRYTFQSAANIPIAMFKLFLYYLVFTPLSTYLGAIAEASGINDYIVLGVTMFANLTTEFVFCKLFIYRNQEFNRK